MTLKDNVLKNVSNSEVLQLGGASKSQNADCGGCLSPGLLNQESRVGPGICVSDELQEMLRLLSQEPHFENRCSNYLKRMI